MRLADDGEVRNPGRCIFSLSFLPQCSVHCLYIYRNNPLLNEHAVQPTPGSHKLMMRIQSAPLLLSLKTAVYKGWVCFYVCIPVCI